MKKSILFLLFWSFSLGMKAQSTNCTFKPPQLIINFGSGDIPEVNTEFLRNYRQVESNCPTDGHYAYTSYTSDCFRGDWFTLIQDHSPGDESGNMLLVNSAYNTGVFFATSITGLKASTTYEFGVWLMNVCRITDKCPFPLLPDLTIMIQTPEGKNLAIFSTGEILRRPAPHWTQHRAIFKTPASASSLMLVMVNKNPGGCGNDFALDDITFRECVKTASRASSTPKANSSKPVAKPVPAPVKKPKQASGIRKPPANAKTPVKDSLPLRPTLKPVPIRLPPAPAILTTRENALAQKIETEAGEISIRLYDNGEIDDDTVSIYHNNILLKSHVRISQKPVTFTIPIDSSHPHHELVMVAENLGSIPPNTSLMIVTAGTRRYEIFISSSEQKNAKVIFDLKE